MRAWQEPSALQAVPRRARRGVAASRRRAMMALARWVVAGCVALGFVSLAGCAAIHRSAGPDGPAHQPAVVPTVSASASASAGAAPSPRLPEPPATPTLPARATPAGVEPVAAAVSSAAVQVPLPAVAPAPPAPPAAQAPPSPSAVPVQPQVAPSAPARQPAAASAAAAKVPAKVAAPASSVAPAPKEETLAPAPARKDAPPALDLKSLETRLKDTQAIGVFTKLALKNQVDDLLAKFRAFHGGRANTPLAELRQAFDRLLLKVLALLQDADPPLANAIAVSREPLWAILSNREKFATV